jgi:cobalamin biosynthesis Co2+ chelatase CbiK
MINVVYLFSVFYACKDIRVFLGHGARKKSDVSYLSITTSVTKYKTSIVVLAIYLLLPRYQNIGL